MSEKKYSLEWFLDKVESGELSDIDWASLGQASINAMIRKNGGTAEEDLSYAMADARHWHTGYLKTKEELDEAHAEIRALKLIINELNQPLTADHPALVEKSKEGYSRGWDDAVAELKPQLRESKEAIDWWRNLTTESVVEILNDAAQKGRRL